MASRAVHPRTMQRTRLAVYTRDGFRCVRCGWAPPIPPDYDGRRALGQTITKANGRLGVRLLELDHIHPHSLGGKFTEANLQTLCNTCNARKGANT